MPNNNNAVTINILGDQSSAEAAITKTLSSLGLMDKSFDAAGEGQKKLSTSAATATAQMDRQMQSVTALNRALAETNQQLAGASNAGGLANKLGSLRNLSLDTLGGLSAFNAGSSTTATRTPNFLTSAASKRDEDSGVVGSDILTTTAPGAAAAGQSSEIGVHGPKEHEGHQSGISAAAQALASRAGAQAGANDAAAKAKSKDASAAENLTQAQKNLGLATEHAAEDIAKEKSSIDEAQESINKLTADTNAAVAAAERLAAIRAARGKTSELGVAHSPIEGTPNFFDYDAFNKEMDEKRAVAQKAVATPPTIPVPAASSEPLSIKLPARQPTDEFGNPIKNTPSIKPTIPVPADPLAVNDAPEKVVKPPPLPVAQPPPLPTAPIEAEAKATEAAAAAHAAETVAVMKNRDEHGKFIPMTQTVAKETATEDEAVHHVKQSHEEATEATKKHSEALDGHKKEVHEAHKEHESFIGKLHEGTTEMVKQIVELLALREAYEMVKDILADAGKEEALKNQLIGLTGSSEMAEAQLKTMTDFAKSANIFPLDQVKEAGAHLIAIGASELATASGLTLIGNAALRSGQSFTTSSDAIGRFYNAIQTNTRVPMAARQLVQLGLVSADTKIKLDRMLDAGASNKSVGDAVIADLAKAKGGIDRAKGSWNGLLQGVANDFSELKESIGAPLIEALEPALASLKGMAEDLAPAVISFAEYVGAGIQTAVMGAKTIYGIFKNGDIGAFFLTSMEIAAGQIVNYLVGGLYTGFEVVGTVLVGMFKQLIDPDYWKALGGYFTAALMVFDGLGNIFIGAAEELYGTLYSDFSGLYAYLEATFKYVGDLLGAGFKLAYIDLKEGLIIAGQALSDILLMAAQKVVDTVAPILKYVHIDLSGVQQGIADARTNYKASSDQAIAGAETQKAGLSKIDFQSYLNDSNSRVGANQSYGDKIAEKGRQDVGTGVAHLGDGFVQAGKAAGDVMANSWKNIMSPALQKASEFKPANIVNTDALVAKRDDIIQRGAKTAVANQTPKGPGEPDGPLPAFKNGQVIPNMGKGDSLASIGGGGGVAYDAQYGLLDQARKQVDLLTDIRGEIINHGVTPSLTPAANDGKPAPKWDSADTQFVTGQSGLSGGGKGMGSMAGEDILGDYKKYLNGSAGIGGDLKDQNVMGMAPKFDQGGEGKTANYAPNATLAHLIDTPGAPSSGARGSALSATVAPEGNANLSGGPDSGQLGILSQMLAALNQIVTNTSARLGAGGGQTLEVTV